MMPFALPLIAAVDTVPTPIPALLVLLFLPTLPTSPTESTCCSARGDTQPTAILLDVVAPPLELPPVVALCKKACKPSTTADVACWCQAADHHGGQCVNAHACRDVATVCMTSATAATAVCGARAQMTAQSRAVQNTVYE
eukprot:12080-Heterococcus_DN1.PRE.1